jgi:hypothetical protein
MPYLFIKSHESIYNFGMKVRQLLNIREENTSLSAKDQFRDSLNKGGDYWYLEFAGFSMDIMVNDNDDDIISEAMIDYTFVLSLSFLPDYKLEPEDAVLTAFLGHLEQFMAFNGYECRIA